MRTGELVIVPAPAQPSYRSAFLDSATTSFQRETRFHQVDASALWKSVSTQAGISDSEFILKGSVSYIDAIQFSNIRQRSPTESKNQHVRYLTDWIAAQTPSWGQLVPHTSSPMHSNSTVRPAFRGPGEQRTSLAKVGHGADEPSKRVPSRYSPYVPSLKMNQKPLLKARKGTYPPPKAM